MAVEIRLVPAPVTFPLRQRVLRPHESLDQLALPGDDDPDAGHVAALDPDLAGDDPAGAVVGTGSVRREAPPWAPDRSPAWRLRGMATAEGRRGEGVGGRVLGAVVDHVAAHGGGLLWCNARVPAQAFYERAGFTTVGEPWVDPVIGPHVAMQREVAAA